MADRRTITALEGSDARSEVLDAAAHAFMESGYTATTLNDIADRLGSTKGRVYHYYRSKSAVFLDVIRTAMDVLKDGVFPLSQTQLPAPEKLTAMAREHSLITMAYYPYFRVTTIGVLDIRAFRAAGGLGSLPGDIIALRDEYESHFAEVITDGIVDGHFRKVRPGLASKEVLGALNWMAIWYRPDGREGPEAIAEEFAQFVVGGLLKRTDGQQAPPRADSNNW